MFRMYGAGWMAGRGVLAVALVSTGWSLVSCREQGSAAASVAASASVSASAGRSVSSAEACGNADSAQCFERARDLYTGQGQAVQVAAAAPLLGAVCEQGGLGACALLGQAYFVGELPLKQDRSRAARLFGKGCEQGEWVSCVNLGNMYLEGLGGLQGGKPAATRQYEKARGAMQSGCEHGDAYQCYLAGRVSAGEDLGLPADTAASEGVYRKAAELARLGCGRKDAQDCHTLAVVWSNTKLEPHAGESVAGMLSKSCELGAAEACTGLGTLQRDGEQGLAKDETKALASFQRACDADDPTGCYLAALIQDNSEQHARPEQAAAKYVRACDRREARACNNLGVMHESGEAGLAKDLLRASSLFERACTLGNHKGCENRSRVETLRRKHRAAAAFRAALAVGSNTHCGLVVEVKKPILLVQTMIGQVWLRIDELYPPGKASCRFHNGQYVAP